MSKDKRSPLKDKPLRNPRQSLDEKIHDVISDYALGSPLLALVLVCMTAMEWLRYYRSVPPAPFAYSVIAVAAVGYAALRLVGLSRYINGLRLGRDGEKAVGRFIDGLRERGYHIFHDVPGDGFNIDHVIIGQAGIFTVETKTHTKPRRGKAQVEFDGESILVDGFDPDRNPVFQARTQARWLRELLAESTGVQFCIKSLIVYPGWYVKYTGSNGSNVSVLSAKALPVFFRPQDRTIAFRQNSSRELSFESVRSRNVAVGSSFGSLISQKLC